MARDVTLYLLSLLAVASARIAWLPASGSALLGSAVLLAFAALFGRVLEHLATGYLTSATLRRNRLLLLVGHTCLVVIALMAATAGGELVAKEATAFGLLHAALYLLAPTLGLDVALLSNALLLVVLASLAGGAPAGVAATGFLGLLALYLAFDNAARKVSAWPTARAGLLLPVAAGALRLVLPVVAGLSLLFSFAPPTPYSRISRERAALASRDTGHAYQWLGLLALGGGGTIFVLGRLLRPRGGEEAATIESIDAHLVLDEPLEPPLPDEGAYGGPRARVIRAYLRFLAGARGQGWKLPGHQTPREIQRRVREPERPLAQLTALFMDARYGPEDPDAEEVREAEGASRTLLSSLGRRKSPRAGGGRG